jgi:hypothetical protein
MQTANIQEPAPMWPVVDWEMTNWIVEKGTLPLQDLNPEYFNHRGVTTPGPTATWIIDQLFSNNLGMNFSENQPRLPLVLVTECAEVLEGWFSCEGVQRDTLQAFFQRAMKMGADAVLWDKHQKVLVPGGIGVNGHKATIEFFSGEIGR